MVEVLLNAPQYQACRGSAAILLETTPAPPPLAHSMKRHAEGENAREFKKHRPNSSPSASSPFASVLPPDPASINGILRQHCRKRLFVTPLHWKLQQLDLLGCRFRPSSERKRVARDGNSFETPAFQEQSQTENQAHFESSTRNLPPSCIMRQIAAQLKGSKEPSHSTLAALQSHTMRCLLGMCGMAYDASPLIYFCFNKRPVAALHTDGIFMRTSSFAESPSLAFLNLHTLSLRRDKSVRPRHVKETNTPANKIRQKKQNRIRPANEFEDPYISAVLIALAQEQHLLRNEAAVERENGPTEYAVFVFALSTLDTPCLYFYSAHIPFSFLDRLDNPSLDIPSRPFDIEYHQIPFFPIKAMQRALNFSIAVIHGDQKFS